MTAAEFLTMLLKHGVDGRVIGGHDYPTADVSETEYVIVTVNALRGWR